MDPKLLNKLAVKPLTFNILVNNKDIITKTRKVEVVKRKAPMEGDGNPKEHEHGFRRRKTEEWAQGRVVAKR